MSESDEQRAIEQLARTNLRTVEGLPGLARRGPHTKHHGCVRAKFRVRGDIPKDLRHGLFAKAREFPALIRLSSAVGQDDRKGDVHGFAIKVLDVPGRKMLEGRERESAQDFVLIDIETFLTGDPAPYELFNRLEKTLPLLVKLTSLARLALFHLPVAVHLTRTKLKAAARRLSSPLETSYFSTTPYALGPNRVKYVAQPREPGERLGVDSPEGLGDALAAALAQGERVFDFGVDVQTDRGRQPIEDPSVNWRKAGAPREWLAEIVIPRQSVDRTAPIAENLTFSPWHTLPAHEPLGYINRARRHVYGEMQCFRHRRNRIVPLESSEAPPSYEHMPPPTFGDLYWAPPKPRGLLARLLKKIGPTLRWALLEWPWIVRLIRKVPWLRLRFNRFIINRYASMTVQRPLPLSLWTPGGTPVTEKGPKTCPAYVSWPSLVDRSFTGRHLPPMDAALAAVLPDRGKVTALFARHKDGDREVFKPSPYSSALLCFFAQWLSDSFLRTHPDDRRRNTSNHELDLCQVYGLGQGSTHWLRAGVYGRLDSRITPRGELPPFLVDEHTTAVKEKFENICFDPALAASFNRTVPPHGRAKDLFKRMAENPNLGTWATTPERRRLYYAGGLDRANSTLLYSAFNTLFLREHNRLAGKLRRRYRTDDDDWLFETARNINIVKYLRILLEDYLNHLGGANVQIRVEPGFADRCLWYRTNRISLEFNLLYRWHSLVPETLWVAGKDGERLDLDNQNFRFNNEIIEEFGIEPLIDSASRQPAGLIGMHNTPSFLLGAEANSIDIARQFRLAPFNDYRHRWDLPRYTDFLDLTGGNVPLARELEALYPDRDGVAGVDRVEFVVGLFAEGIQKHHSLPTLLSYMVASDAFSHALTNPLLAAYVFDEGALTDFGVNEIERVGTLAQIAADNCAPRAKPPLTTFALSQPET